MKKIFQPLVLSIISLLFLICCNTNRQTNQNSDDSLALNTVKDIDGNLYQTVIIGKYVWMKENLKVTHYRNGDEIPNIKGDTSWMNYKKGAYCSYNNDTALAHTYGHLYNWYAVDDTRNICPVGWHVATWTEFDDLNFLYGSNMSGLFLKESGTLHWESPNDATNESNFTALPGGTRFAGFERLGVSAFFWNREDYLGDACSEDKGCAYECSLVSEYSYFLMDWGRKYRGMSVRCVKDSIEVK